MNRIFGIKRFALVVIGFLTVQLVWSQENFKPGYIIKNHADTVHGYVDYRNWDRNPDIIYFKTNLEDAVLSFNPIQITEFGVNNDIYLSAIVEAEISPLHESRLEDNPYTKLRTDTTFLQTLFKGHKSLYLYKNADGRENFYIKKDTSIELLIYKRYIKIEEERQLITENKSYIGQLAIYLNDCEKIRSNLNTIAYKQNSLIKLFKEYYNCLQIEVAFKKEPKKTNVTLGALVGGSISTLEFESDNFNDLSAATYNPSVNFSAGLFFDILLPGNLKRWSVYNEILYTSYFIEGVYEEFHNENYYSTTSIDIGYSFLRLNNLIRYKYPLGPVFLFVNGGMSNGFSFNETNYKKIETNYYSVEKITEEQAMVETRKHEQAYDLGAGLTYKRLSLECRYEKGNGMTNYQFLSSSTKKYYFLVGYRF
jgi:hypothetical protein